MKKAIVIIPTYNKANILHISLKNLLRSKKRELFDVFVVDNGSTDNNNEVVKKFKDVKYLRRNKNYMISNSINYAFFKQRLQNKYKYIIVLAHDALVNNDTIHELLITLNFDRQIGMTGPAAYQYHTKKLSCVGLSINPLSSLLQPYKTHPKKARINHFASCLAVRADVYEKVHGLDDVLFPMVFEEPDLGERILKAGFKIIPSVKAKIYHPIYIGDRSVKEEIRKERILTTRERSYLFF